MLEQPRHEVREAPEMAAKSPKNGAKAKESSPQGDSEPQGVMLPNSHRRGSGDTPWERTGKARTGLFWKMLVASLIAHAFLTPGPALLGLIAMLPALDPEAEEYVEIELEAIPVGMATPPSQPDVPEPEEATQPEPVPDEPDPEEETPPEAEEQTPPEPEPDAEEPEPDTPVGPTTENADPHMLAGKVAALANPNAHVKMILYTDVVRDHVVGPKVSKILRHTPQWKDFFGPSNIDPIEDIDVVYVAGPQLRNSSQVFAVVEHNMPRERIEVAFENLVQRQGKWIDRGRLAAEARADRADRIFAAASDEIVVVAPLKLKDQVLSYQAKPFDKTAGDVALVVHVDTPKNAAKGFGLDELLEPMKWARADVRPTSNGGAVVKIRILDESPELAIQHAILLEQFVDSSTSRSLFGAKISMIKSVSFKGKGNEVHGTIEVTRDQLLAGAEFIALKLEEIERRVQARAKKAEKSKSDDAKTLSAAEKKKRRLERRKAKEPTTPEPGPVSPEGTGESPPTPAPIVPSPAPSPLPAP